MKRVGVQYLNPVGGIYAYDVPDDTTRGDLILDKHNRIAIVRTIGHPYNGAVLKAEQLELLLQRGRFFGVKP